MKILIPDVPKSWSQTCWNPVCPELRIPTFILQSRKHDLGICSTPGLTRTFRPNQPFFDFFPPAQLCVLLCFPFPPHFPAQFSASPADIFACAKCGEWAKHNNAEIWYSARNSQRRGNIIFVDIIIYLCSMLGANPKITITFTPLLAPTHPRPTEFVMATNPENPFTNPENPENQLPGGGWISIKM